MSSGSVVSLSSFNLLFFTQVLTVLTSSIKYNEYVTDKGKNISIPCTIEGNVMWVKENGHSSTIIQTGKFLVLSNVSAADRGLYVCFASVPPSNASTVFAVDSVADGAVVAVASNATATTTPGKSISSASTKSTTKSQPTKATTATAPAGTIATATATVAAHAGATIASTTSPLPMPMLPTTEANVSARGSASNNSSAVIVAARQHKVPTALQKTDDETMDAQEEEYQAILKVNLTVRAPPGPVTQLYFKASTILGFLIWRFNKSNSGGYPVRSFTAEFRNISYTETPYNQSFEHEWSRMDPINIAPNVRQMEVYRLEPNTTYEFRIWANNQLGSGDVVTTNVTTLPETKEEDLIRLIQPDLDNFDPRIWIVAVSVVLGTLVILAIGLCIVLSKECYQASQAEFEVGWDGIELIPNIILNPGFCESDGPFLQPYTRTIIFGEDDESDGYDSEESDHEPRMEKFKRKVSVFFTGPTIKRI